MTFTIKKYLLKHKVFSYVASASFRTIASQLSGFKEKRILRNPDAKLTPKTNLKGQGPFFSYLAPNLSVMNLKISMQLRAYFRRVLLHTAKHALGKY